MPDRVTEATRRRAFEGVALSLAAAAAFGVLAPAAKGAVAQVGPVRGAGLAYLAAGVVALAALALRSVVSDQHPGGPIGRNGALRLSAMILFGGVAGPALFFAGVARVAAHHAAVVQHLEFVLTAGAAMAVLGERLGRRGLAGLLLVGCGLLVFAVHGAGTEGPDRFAWSGLLLIAAACIAWAVDNTLARGASDLDPLAVVAVKGLGAGAILTGATLGGRWPGDARAWGLVLLAGGVGVGVSLILELLAVRRIGAALNAGLFATGPAFGFVWGVIALGERSAAWTWAALGLCVVGAVALATDRHRHHHVHGVIDHAHHHDHGDGHHAHRHEPGIEAEVEHAHAHRHEAVGHEHPHVHDEHHRHRH